MTDAFAMTGQVLVSVCGKTDLGRTRDHNEDTFLVADLSTRRAGLVPSVADHAVGPLGSLFMVADGMGGAAAGELASSLAAKHIFEHLAREWGEAEDHSPDRFALQLHDAVEHANELIHGYAQQHPDVRGMGTTVTAAGVLAGRLYLAQVGDSRAYLVRGGRAFQLTKDQSLTQRLVDAGELTEEEAAASARRNIILQALGPDPRVKVVLTTEPLRRGDMLLLCSDGLSNVVKREELAEHVATYEDLATLCSTLIELANERGGPDNITVVAARFVGDALQPANGDEEPSPTLIRAPGTVTSSDELIPGLAPARPPSVRVQRRVAAMNTPTPTPVTGTPVAESPIAPPEGAPAAAMVEQDDEKRSIAGWLFAAVLAAVLGLWLAFWR
ncbi:MAG TPA: protein phosphatase 2C domain-containing protein [Gemmatimonadales bacterium]|nr:protein phosphatase 2C domain-containing protein [Gemmatimonadales bacterium]